MKGFILNLFNKGVKKDVELPSNDESVIEKFAEDFLDGERIVFKELASKEEDDSKAPVYDKATVILKATATGTSIYHDFHVHSHDTDDTTIDETLTDMKINGLVRDDVRTRLFSVRRY